MTILLDSNVLLRLVHLGDPQWQLADDAVSKLLRNKEEVCVVPQNFYEFWVVTTRPTSVNGLGYNAAQTKAEIVKFKNSYLMHSDKPDIYVEWEKLVSMHAIVGKNAHDARLVAAMIVHGITHLLTFNKQDFQRFTNITVVTPADVMAMP